MENYTIHKNNLKKQLQCLYFRYVYLRLLKDLFNFTLAILTNYFDIEWPYIFLTYSFYLIP